jgi:hypothetical protein
MTSPAFFAGRHGLYAAPFHMSFLKIFPQFIVIMRPWRLVATVAVSVVVRWMAKALDPPCADPVALPAVIAKSGSMAVHVALGTLEFPA